MVIHRPMIKRYGEALRVLAPDVRLGVENHFVARDELDDWATESPWITLDVEHLWKFTLQDAPLDELLQVTDWLFQTHGNRLIHVHLPGYSPGNQEHRPMPAEAPVMRAVFFMM